MKKQIISLLINLIICISLDQTISDALKVIDKGEERICFLVDESKTLQGDYRR